jgi:CheY-like chemotaxis protein
MARVLIVDDSTDLQETLQMLLEGEGFEVAAAPDGERGLQLTRELHVVCTAERFQLGRFDFSAVDAQLGPRQPSRGRRDQVRHEVGDVLRLSVPGDAGARQESLFGFFDRNVVPLGPRLDHPEPPARQHGPRRDAVDPDTVPRDFDRRTPWPAPRSPR